MALEHALEANDVSWQDAGKETLSGSINVVRATDAKGLEFDAVIVIEPAAIVNEVDRGHRLLYFALHRATKRLSVVHSTSEAIPLELAPDETQQRLFGPEPPRQLVLPVPRSSGEARTTAPRPTSATASPEPTRLLRAIASQFAGEIRTTIQPKHRQDVLDQLAHELELQRDE